MVDEGLQYDRMVEGALRGVVRQALDVAAHKGLPGAHHFYITFRTRAPGVVIPDFLLAQYPEEMTIVLQHQFRDLIVDKEGFSVTLSFGGRPAVLVVPFAALAAFVDPSVRFGLQFDAAPEAAPVDETAPPANVERFEGQPATGSRTAEGDGAGDEQPVPAAGAEVVTLDQFRKK
ncbi:MAG: SspB family protein [Alphaproteobacteria bacterium]